MIFGAEIGLLIWGIVALATGKLTLGKDHVVHGTAARLLAIIAIAPWPLAFVCGFVFGFTLHQAGGVWNDDVQIPLMLLEAGIVVGCVGVIYAAGWPLAVPLGQQPFHDPSRWLRDDQTEDAPYQVTGQDVVARGEDMAARPGVAIATPYQAEPDASDVDAQGRRYAEDEYYADRPREAPPSRLALTGLVAAILLAVLVLMTSYLWARTLADQNPDPRRGDRFNRF